MYEGATQASPNAPSSMEPETIMPSTESPPRESALDDAAASYSLSYGAALDESSPNDKAYIQKAEKPSDNDNNSGSYNTAPASLKQEAITEDSNDNYNLEAPHNTAPASLKQEVITEDSNDNYNLEAPHSTAFVYPKQEVITIDSSDSNHSSPVQASSNALPPGSREILPIDINTLLVASPNALPPGYREILPVDINTLLVTRHRFGRLAPIFLGVRDGYYYVLISEGTENRIFPRDRELPANTI